ncbi:Haloacid dehalogenase-like hydrolase-domain-containing protein [Tuber brumale]|nr:Haloacid dehalogenase-like hydrolase-domain-containing protein [Tuber brumale]
MTEKKLTSFKALSFDVYGTLIDWESGIYAAASPLLSRTSPQTDTSKPAFLKRYHTLEAKHQAEAPALPYSALLSGVYRDLHEQLCPETPLSSAEVEAFGNGVPAWPAFPDTKEALARLKKYYKLIALSNIDEASFAGSLGKLGGAGTFDEVCTAEKIGSYKPDLKNFEYMLGKAAGLGVRKEEVLVTAQSLWHDHVPAGEAGLVGAWIDREGAVMGVAGVEGVVNGERVGSWKWRFRTLEEMADAVEMEAEAVAG